MSGAPVIHLVLYFVAGTALGAVYFVLLLRTVQLRAADAAAIRLVPLYVVRLAAAIAVFWIIALQGALPLLIALLGFLVARIVVQRRSGAT